MAAIAHRLGSFVISLATALAILAIVMPLFLNPVWVAFEQDRSQAAAWTGFSPTDLRAATDAILADLVFGPRNSMSPSPARRSWTHGSGATCATCGPCSWASSS